MTSLEIDNSNKYLTFQDVTPEGRKTVIIEVIAVNSGILLGKIQWFGRWRQYCFFTVDGDVFNAGCLKTILHNVDVLNRKHREAR